MPPISPEPITLASKLVGELLLFDRSASERASKLKQAADKTYRLRNIGFVVAVLAACTVAEGLRLVAKNRYSTSKLGRPATSYMLTQAAFSSRDKLASWLVERDNQQRDQNGTDRRH